MKTSTEEQLLKIFLVTIHSSVFDITPSNDGSYLSDENVGGFLFTDQNRNVKPQLVILTSPDHLAMEKDSHPNFTGTTSSSSMQPFWPCMPSPRSRWIPTSLPGSPLHMQPDSINEKVNHAVNDSSAESDQTNIEDAVKGNLNVESAQENVDEAVREYSSAESMQQHVEDDVRVDASADSEQKHVKDTTEVDKSDQSVVKPNSRNIVKGKKRGRP